ncbi:double-strand break repair mre11 [Fusarium albosuccineum]|uniref:Double-strand break repair mre11 n=1 Tax=Fusarium albosuccineum TaxID=1237068 RepID=A0A8H4PHN1_9HYPO|nr:double-strand break repair mre11 [Fusarium albosuccineum]
MVKVESLVQDFLSAQSLKVLPQGPFGDAVTQFVTKDDKHAMELFVSEHLTGQVRSMLGLESDDEDLNSAMDIYRTRIEQEQASGMQTTPAERKRVLKPKPATWDSDFDGSWENEPDAWTYEDADPAESSARTSAPGPAPARKTTRGRGKAAQKDDDDLMDEDEPPAKKPAKRATRTTKAAPTRKTPARGRGRKPFEESEEEDVVMESEEEPAPPPPKTRRAAATRSNAKTTAKTTAATTRGAAKSTRQTKLNFSQSQAKSGTQKSDAVEISDDEISDDDAFEPAPAPRTRRR